MTTCFNGIITSMHIGFPKEETAFWAGAGAHIGFSRESTLFADDTEAVLKAAGTYGTRYLVHISRFSSTAPPRPSELFPSIEGFHEIMPAF